MRTMIAAVMLTTLLVGGAEAQTYQIKWHAINSGGGPVAGGAYKLNGSLGQSAAGYMSGASMLHWVGFWSGDVPTPVAVSSITAAKISPTERS